MKTFLIICVLIATVLTVYWILMYVKYKQKYAGLLDGVDGNVYTLKEVYFVGLGTIELYESSAKKKITTSDKAIEMIKKFSEIYGRAQAELYFYVYSAATVSLLLTFLPIGLMLACILKSMLGFVCGILVVFVLVYGLRSGIKGAIESKKHEIENEFPRMVSKLTLLINAGMLVRRAWDEVATSNYTNPLYAEMRTTSKDIQEGMSIDQAMDAFASRCGLKEIRKFSSIYVQTINRGASESIESMRVMAEEAWEKKKQLSKQEGELASQKLLIPNLIMFFGILLVVVVPMVSTLLKGF